MGWLKQQELVSYSHGGWKVQDKVLAESVPSEGSLLACREQLSCYVLTQGGRAPTWALLSLLVRALIPSPWELEPQYRNLGLGRRGKTNIQPIQCVTEFWPMRYLEGLEKTFLIDRKRSICTASLFTCFWTLLSNFRTFGWSHLYHVERANKMAEKPDWNHNIFEVQNWSKLESPHLWTTFYEILNILFI